MHHMAWNTALGIYKLHSLACASLKVLRIKPEERSNLSTTVRLSEAKQNKKQKTRTKKKIQQTPTNHHDLSRNCIMLLLLW